MVIENISLGLSAYIVEYHFLPYLPILFAPFLAIFHISWEWVVTILILNSLFTIVLFNFNSRREFFIFYMFTLSTLFVALSLSQILYTVESATFFSNQIMLNFAISGLCGFLALTTGFLGLLLVRIRNSGSVQDLEDGKYSENRLLVYIFGFI